MPGTISGVGDIMMNKVGKIPVLILIGRDRGETHTHTPPYMYKMNNKCFKEKRKIMQDREIEGD